MRYVEIEICSILQTQFLQPMSGPPPPVESGSTSNALVGKTPNLGPSNQQSEEEMRRKAIQMHSDGLVHAVHCYDATCQNPLCQKMKNLLIHYQSCQPLLDSDKKCPVCYHLFIVCQNHAKHCTVLSNCPVLLCEFLKKNLYRTEQPAQAPIPPKIQPNPFLLAVKSIFEILKSPQLSAEERQRIIQIMSSDLQLAPSLNSQRNSLRLQLHQGNINFADQHRQQMRDRIQQIDRIFAVLQYVRPKTTNKSSLLSDLCARFSLDDAAMSQFLQLASDNSVDVNFRNPAGHPLLSLLLRYNQTKSLVPCLKALLQRKEINLEEMSTFGLNALTILCRYNATESLVDCVKLLIQRGVKMRSCDSYQRNALLLVCEFYQGEKMMELMQLLLQNGTYVLQENKYAENALHLLCRYYKRGNLIDLIHLLISRGVKVDCVNNRKQTALHSLCQHYPDSNPLSIMKLLVQNGLDATAEDDNRETALTLLCHYYRKPNLLEIIRFLVIDCGLNINNNVKGDLTRSALLVVCYYKSFATDDLVNIVRFLIQHMDVTATDAQGRNVLHILCYTIKGLKLAEILRILIEETTVDVNAIDHSGLKPIDVFRQQKTVKSVHGVITELLCS